MKKQKTAKQRSKFSIWFQAIRVFSLTASAMPVTAGAVMALYYDIKAEWRLFPLIFIASVAMQAATNLVSDYFDYKKGVDKDYKFSSSRTISDGILQPRQLLIAGITLFSIVFGIGMIFVAYRGLPIFLLGLFGIIGGYFYCADPIGYKYYALGDFLVFALMGPLMVIGSFYTLTGTYNNSVLFLSLPIGFLVTVILHANNLRDIIHDRELKIRTVASVIGFSAAKYEYYFLIFGAYLSVILMVIFKIVPVWSLLVIISIPSALKIIKTIKANSFGNIEQIAIIDVKTAQLHLQFTLLLSISILLGKFI